MNGREGMGGRDPNVLTTKKEREVTVPLRRLQPTTPRGRISKDCKKKIKNKHH
jgi:hypothetical protein